MTTIVADLKQMSADTRVTWSDPSNDRMNTASSIKVEIIREEILGTSGDFAAGVRFFDWYKAGSKGRKPKLVRDFRAIRLNKTGIYIIDGDDTTWVKVDAPFYAIGSGAHYAIGAMEMGATTDKAVSIAEKHDNYTGGSITTLELP